MDPARCALVVHERRLRGVLTPADVRRIGPSSVPRLARHDLDSGVRRLEVADAMRPAPAIVAPDASLGEAAQRMLDTRSRELAASDGVADVIVVRRRRAYVGSLTRVAPCPVLAL